MSDENGIRIDVETDYLEAESNPGEGRYVFAYTITIHNDGEQPARLLTRYWRITDDNGHVREVHGDGVVGEQPYLRPGEGFRYTSGANLETPLGTMAGRYGMIDANGEHFQATIPEFLLTTPRILH
ncbi:Co2+/Mg2+ efflux protein ApaG [Halofilum ochraceum]|uniref:Co2+/Mg2+ efflux protein ApaG n=1 Tax=Halofilum ochraceum TaxID=1611323 RepID=UPI00082A647C|nr:Co2+/Mg2+ efflux protein ApaG [Halofilum ochraceum]